MLKINKIYSVTWSEVRKCRTYISAPDVESAKNVIYNGDLDEATIDVLSEDISDVQSVTEVD